MSTVNVPPGRRLGAGVLLLATSAVLSACGSGSGSASSNQLGFDNGTAPGGDGIGGLEAVALFGLVPLALLLTIAALVWLPGMVRGNRYRPSRGWSAAPLWFGGPPDPVAAVESAQTDDLRRGGAGGTW